MDARLTQSLEGRYTIDREIGAGGMATVYLARDVRHNRNVALKVLNPELGAVLGVERFLAEIQVTANLQHPNLLPLFDSGEANGLLFYVMPYVQGESLRARLQREKQLPVDEAIRIATAIGGALDYAHRHHVIHRDLKPENILLHEGQPLIADFGIALAVSNAGGARITQTGLSLGTPQYMSPEQATGDRVVDGRTDIYSLGAMLYEMLVGDPPHSASTSQAIIAKVLTETPSRVRTSRASVPPHVDAAIAHALEKLAADRFSTANEFVDALRTGSATLGNIDVAAVPHANRRAPKGVGAWRVAAVVLGIGALGAAAFAVRERGRARAALEAAPVVRAAFDLPAGIRVNDVLPGTTIAVSPQGDAIAYTSVGTSGFRMYTRRVNELTAREIADANVAGRNLTFSPDGRWLAFSEGNVIKKLSLSGGQVLTIGASSFLPYGMAWAPNDTIYIGGFSGMQVVPAAGGTPAMLVRADTSPSRIGQRWPVMLPDRRTIVYSSGNTASPQYQLSTIDVRTGQIVLHDVQMSVTLGYMHGHVVYVSPAGNIMAVPFDIGAMRPSGEPITLDDGVVIDATAGAKASLSESGTLIYLKGRPDLQLVLVADATRAPAPLIRENQVYANPRYSPNGQRVAMTVFGANSTDIYIYDIARNTSTRLTTEGSNMRPEWTADGKRVVYRSERAGKVAIWWQPADGSGPAELLYEPEVEPYEALVSPDSNWLIVRTAPSSKYQRDVLAVRLDSTRAVTPIVTGPFSDTQPRLSPDGRWILWQSNETTRFEVYVRPFPGAGARVQVSDNGGTEALWSAKGDAIYYRGPTGEVIKVDVTTQGSVSIGQRRVVLTGDYLTDTSHPSWDVSPTGEFLMLKRAGSEAQVIVVHNWGRELRERTHAGR